MDCFVASLLAMTGEMSRLLRPTIPQPRALRSDIIDTVLQMHPLVRRRVLHHAHARSPFLRRADRPRGKAAAAVRADVTELGLHAIRTERAFVRADPSVGRARRQVLV